MSKRPEKSSSKWTLNWVSLNYRDSTVYIRTLGNTIETNFTDKPNNNSNVILLLLLQILCHQLLSPLLSHQQNEEEKKHIHILSVIDIPCQFLLFRFFLQRRLIANIHTYTYTHTHNS